MRQLQGKKGGKFWKIAAIALLATMFLPNFWVKVAPSHAATEEDARAEWNATIRELLDALDTKELQDYLDTLTEFGGTTVSDKLFSLISGDAKLDYASIGQAALSFVWEEGQAMLPAFAVILAVSILCGILDSLKNGFLQSTTSDIIHFISYLSVGAVVLAVLIGVLQTGFSAVESMRRQMETVFPILLTLMAASGGTVSAGVFRPAVVFMSGGIVELFCSLVLPVGVVIIVLAFVGNLSVGVRAEKLAELFKSVTKWVVGLALGLFGVFLTVQGMTAAQYDGLSLRAVKYVISGSVPLVGNFLSGGMELVVAGSAALKNALGTFSVFLLAACILRPLLLFVAFQLFLRISAAATEPIGGKISSFLSRVATDSGYFLAGLLAVAFLYFLTLVLMVCCSGGIF